ncbi:MAG: hypothetical protein JXQ75_03425, partial [Phycisphaerae bacterium]|nr:hypothetical protein [Phycisphaerae bacterium]
AARGKRENSGSETSFLTVKTTGETPVPQRGFRPQPKCGMGVPPVSPPATRPVPQFCHGLIGF